MLSVLPISPPRISHNFYLFYSYFIPMPSPIIPIIRICKSFILSVTMRSTVYLIANTYMGIYLV